jgi:hypothetical protein
MKRLNAPGQQLERKAHWIIETRAWFSRQTSMNKYPRSKRLHGAHAAHTTRTARAGIISWRKQLPGPTQGLLICLGWLRLFQCIVLPQYAAAGRRGPRYER